MTLIKYKPSNSFLPTAFSEFFEPDFFPMHRNILNTDMQLPAVNISENEKEHIIEVWAAGYQKDQFNVEIEDNKLTISAHTQEQKQNSSKDSEKDSKVESKEKEEKKNEPKKNEPKKNEPKSFYTRQEFRASSFKRSFTLPKNVETDTINASYDNGVLKLILPKKAEVIQKKKVNIS